MRHKQSEDQVGEAMIIINGSVSTWCHSSYSTAVRTRSLFGTQLEDSGHRDGGRNAQAICEINHPVLGLILQILEQRQARKANM